MHRGQGRLPRAIFAGRQALEFAARSILVDGDVSVIEFALRLDATHLQGADIITWRDRPLPACPVIPEG